MVIILGKLCCLDSISLDMICRAQELEVRLYKQIYSGLPKHTFGNNFSKAKFPTFFVWRG